LVASVANLGVLKNIVNVLKKVKNAGLNVNAQIAVMLNELLIGESICYICTDFNKYLIILNISTFYILLNKET
jgi:hypothetical protein